MAEKLRRLSKMKYRRYDDTRRPPNRQRPALSTMTGANKETLQIAMSHFVTLTKKFPKRRGESKNLNRLLKYKASKMLQRLQAGPKGLNFEESLRETTLILRNVTNSMGVTLYMVDHQLNEIYEKTTEYPVARRHQVRYKIEMGTTVAASVAFTKDYVMIDDILEEPSYPEGTGYKDLTIKSVLCVPIVTPEGDCYAVIELFRRALQGPYSSDDLQISVILTGWIGAALHEEHQRFSINRQQQLNDYFLELIKSFFGNETATRELTQKMMRQVVIFAKLALGAERGSFFIIDKDQDELVADLYDDNDDVDDSTHRKVTRVRFNKERGIAGVVARTGVYVNIKDAYNDHRFNKEVDQKTGFITRSILCMPIVGKDGMLGVIQVINKSSGGCFNRADESLFKSFAVYCAMTLHYAKVYTELCNTKLRDRLHLRMLDIQKVPCVHDLDEFLAHPVVPLPFGFKFFSWYIIKRSTMPQLSLYMIGHLVGSHGINIPVLMKALLVIKNFYRDNPYHNFEHAFNVCHCMYLMLIRNRNIFTPLEIKSLIIASLCHDVDHGAYTNAFLHLIKDDMAFLYEKSTLENHHYQITMSILKHYPIYRLNKGEFKKMDAYIYQAIIATDLALYFKNKADLLRILRRKQFNWNLEEHRMHVKALMMTGCDLSGQCKPFHITKRNTDNIYREFYHQGDLERSKGLFPISIMDREKASIVPWDQIQFLSAVVIPCVELLARILPNTTELLDGALAVRSAWIDVKKSKYIKCWRRQESIAVDLIE